MSGTKINTYLVIKCVNKENIKRHGMTLLDSTHDSPKRFDSKNLKRFHSVVMLPCKVFNALVKLDCKIELFSKDVHKKIQFNLVRRYLNRTF